MLRAEVQEVHEIAEKIAAEKVKPLLAELREVKEKLAETEKRLAELSPKKGGNEK